MHKINNLLNIFVYVLFPVAFFLPIYLSSTVYNVKIR